MTKDIERFEEVFKKSIQTMHEVNVKQFGSAMANIMLPALEQMKPIFKIVYEQGVTDGSEKLEGCVVVPVELSESIAEKLALGKVEKPRQENDVVWQEIADRSYKDHLIQKKWEIIRNYKELVEAARGGNE